MSYSKRKRAQGMTKKGPKGWKYSMLAAVLFTKDTVVSSLESGPMSPLDKRAEDTTMWLEMLCEIAPS